MKDHRAHRLLLLVAACPISGTMALLAQNSAQRFPLTAARVSQALLDNGVAVSRSDLNLPSSLTTAVATPDLAVREAAQAGPGLLRVRLECKIAGECLPFFALINLHDSNRVVEAQEHLHASSHADLPTRDRNAPALLPGQRVTLLLENTHMCITLPAISIDAGALGAEVRVSSLDRKQTYRGVVSGAAVVRGALP